jgi:hypothetical protein
MLELQETSDLSTVCLVYQGDSSYDDLAGKALRGGLNAITNDFS